jgi:hypothetical protein
MTTTQTRTEGMVGVQRRTGGAPRSLRLVGGLFLCTSGIHVGIVSADPSMRSSGSREAPAAARPAPAPGGVAARLGWMGLIAFHVLLVLFGWGFLFWSGPVLTFLVWVAVRD